MDIEILLGADVFWRSLEKDMGRAKNSVCLQAMTFEADSVGLKVNAALVASPATNKYLSVDHFSNLIISDHFIYGPHRLKSAAFRKEIKDTKHIFSMAKQNGIQFHFSNPYGFLLYKYPHRNHKKLMLIDDEICYIGGINFSEHNFAWHDMMLRIHNKKIAKFFREDFNCTINGENQSLKTSIDGTDIFVLNGYASRHLYEDLLAVIDAAQSSITVVSPYITAPFLDHIGERAKAGVNVRIITPQANNKSLLKYYLQAQQKHYPFSIWLYEKKMSHLKALLIDDKIVMTGSTNFDFASYFLEQEYCMVIRDPDMVRNFTDTVVTDALSHARMYEPGATKTGEKIKQFIADKIIRLASAVCRMLARILYKE